MEYLATFFTHSGAIKFEKYLKKRQIKCEALPVPRKLSSNCGIAVRFFLEEEDLNRIIFGEEINQDIEKVVVVKENEYCQVYVAD